MSTKQMKIKFDCGEVWIGEDGILRQVYTPGAELTLKVAEQVEDVVINLTGGKPIPAYVDARNLIRIAREARVVWLQDEFIACFGAVATLNTPVVNFLGRYLIKFNKPPYPFRFFSSEAQATAIAILDNTSLGHVLGNLFVRLSKPHYQTKLFSKENEAIEWLNTYASLDTLSVNEGKQ